MPSFFEGFKRVLQGKPVFDPSDQADSAANASQPNPPTEQPANDDSSWFAPTPSPQPQQGTPQPGPKVLPRVFVERTKTYTNGSRMDCYADIRNDSNQDILLDKVRVMTVPRELDHVLKPHERRQFLIYSGSRPNNDNNDQCDIQYKSMDGDYFCTLHNVVLVKQDDGTFYITHINYHGFKDI